MAFEARGSNDGHILFSSCDGCDGFEIVIGGWSNQYSVIREYKQEEDVEKIEVGCKRMLGNKFSSGFFRHRIF